MLEGEDEMTSAVNMLSGIHGRCPLRDEWQAAGYAGMLSGEVAGLWVQMWKLPAWRQMETEAPRRAPLI